MENEFQPSYTDGTLVKKVAGWVYPKDLITAFEAGTWYVLRITLDDVNGFTAEVYAENDATTYASYTCPMPAGKAWRFRHWTRVGNTYLDNYMEWTGTERGAFGYDALDRLVRAAVDGTLVYTQVYTYNAIGNMLSKSGVGTYTYPTSGAGSVRPHAVTAAGSGRSFGYDANGNMVTRVLSGTTYTLVYDAENRLIQVKQGATVLASYAYDGDGTLVRKVAGGQTTVYVGSYYEKNLTTGVLGLGERCRAGGKDDEHRRLQPGRW